MSLFMPEIFQKLSDPTIKTVFIAGCGGGFDFIHSSLLIPDLKRLQKSILIGSYSFGRISELNGLDVDNVYLSSGQIIAKRISARSSGSTHYAPEIHYCSYLDKSFPSDAPHHMFAYYGRDFTVSMLREFYESLVEKYSVDAIILMDGGSDSLMAGDEQGLGDPIEDAVSVAAVSTLRNSTLKLRALISIGLGADRFNDVSDASSLRAIAELTAMGGFLGSISLSSLNDVNHSTTNALSFYRGLVDHIYSRQEFQSVLTGCIIASAEGHFGLEVPSLLKASKRVKEGDVYTWPLMSILWAFDVSVVAKRSLLIPWITDAVSVKDMHRRFDEGRLRVVVRAVENIPRHETMTAHRLHPLVQRVSESVCPNCSRIEVRFDIDSRVIMMHDLNKIPSVFKKESKEVMGDNSSRNICNADTVTTVTNYNGNSNINSRKGTSSIGCIIA